MRLIDADELKRSISQNNKIPRIFQQVINSQPTAYDIDKVVEEIEKANQGCCNYCGCDLYSDDVIEIVKQSVISDDVCEWIKYDYRTICPKNHDTNNPYWRIPDNTDKLKYCPYCGKKIKVVE